MKIKDTNKMVTRISNTNKIGIVGKWGKRATSSYLGVTKQIFIFKGDHDSDQTLRTISTKFLTHVLRIKYSVEFVTGQIFSNNFNVAAISII